MKYAKMLGLLAVAAAALMAFAGVASATTLTSPAGTTYTGTIKASAEGTTTLHNSSLGIPVNCTASTVEGKVEKHGSGVTVSGNISSLTFTGCGTNDVTVLSGGSLEVHNIAGGTNGTLTSNTAKITINSTSLGISCGYETKATDIGLLTSSAATGKTATLDIASAIIPRTFDSVFCGSAGEWTGSYVVNTPDSLLVDP